jgi:hypothetical protein
VLSLYFLFLFLLVLKHIMKIISLAILTFSISCISAAPIIETGSGIIQKREDSAERKQNASLFGGLRGFSYPNFQGGTTTFFGGQTPDED